MGVTWLETERSYQSGVSHGVLFPPTGAAVPWNGLTSVQEVIASADAVARYMDGVKRYDAVPKRVYQGLLSTYTIPRAFAPCLGEVDVVPGITLTRQPRKRFNLTYETNVNGEGRIIHLVSNVTANPRPRPQSTISEKVSPSLQTFQLNAVPPTDASIPWPTAHLMVDSTKMPDYIFKGVEDLIYGADGRNPFFPNFNVLRYIIGNPLIEPLMEPI